VLEDGVTPGNQVGGLGGDHLHRRRQPVRLGGTLEELHEVVAMYRAGQIRPDVQRFSMDKALEAYEALEAGTLSGRAVVTPNA